MYHAPTAVSHFGHGVDPSAKHVRTYLRRKWKSQLLTLRGDLEQNAPALHGDRLALGDALARLEQALELALAD
jgi:hypothetical protein